MKPSLASLEFFNSLSARKKDRLAGKHYLEKHPELLPTLLFYSIETKQARIQVVISWCIELYLIEHLDELTAYFNRYLEALPNIRNESMRRSLSKILYYYVKKEHHRLSKHQKQRIITLAFDWLIEPAQVATLNFALRIVKIFEDYAPWVRKELHAIIKKQLPDASPGYSAAAREILK